MFSFIIIIIQVQIATGTSLQQPTTVFQNKGLPIPPRLMSQDINPITMCSIGQKQHRRDPEGAMSMRRERPPPLHRNFSILRACQTTRLKFLTPRKRILATKYKSAIKEVSRLRAQLKNFKSNLVPSVLQNR